MIINDKEAIFNRHLFGIFYNTIKKKYKELYFYYSNMIIIKFNPI